ncbi:uncharacterized protein K460DRAFT_143720 [Cucurbitaria berberidis CBS 394.84]|uniref:Uncharacterized protein n=1 Tax=Cucurbitaria berberidis CBS 394.84 TaxID=1168544 RepID=A0A9P4GCY5_9PLEO|nr:uncharacterized protein K460DRAFT_143720 [Cucurbitaria berberidis CBS 394.84]KAF1843347.1 hypothetical protein K460DRAFT_143720 [Cucurbitaria berberidis CBS 394.84]
MVPVTVLRTKDVGCWLPFTPHHLHLHHLLQLKEGRLKLPYPYPYPYPPWPVPYTQASRQWLLQRLWPCLLLCDASDASYWTWLSLSLSNSASPKEAWRRSTDGVLSRVALANNRSHPPACTHVANPPYRSTFTVHFRGPLMSRLVRRNRVNQQGALALVADSHPAGPGNWRL